MEPSQEQNAASEPGPLKGAQGEHESWYQRLVELSPDGILVIQQERVVQANRSALQLLVTSDRGQLIGRVFWDFMHPEVEREKMAALKLAFSRGASVPTVYLKMLSNDGQVVDVELRAGPLTQEVDGPMQVVLRNVTAHRQLEEQMRQAQKMEAVGKLAGGVAHDFNNMLTVINGHSALLLEEGPLDEFQRQSIDQIAKAGMRAAGLTSQLLAFSRRQVLQPKIVDVNGVFKGMEQMLRTLAGDSIQLIIEPGEHVGRIKVDPGQLEQVLLNLAVNARDAMIDGGQLIIGSSNEVLTETTIRQSKLELQPGPHVVVRVSDTGTGIDPKVLPHIFEPFFTTKPKGKGTGLGLSTVYGVVKQSGGALAVSSEARRGTTFSTYFPRVDAPLSMDSLGTISMSELRGTEGVLVVEDEPAVLMLVRDTLKGRGYRVLEAQDGIEALFLVSHYNEPIDLLLTDLIMPQMGGRELAEQLKGRWPDLKVMFMSGYTDDDIVRHGVNSVGFDFLQKPFTPQVLASRIRKVLDGVVPSDEKGTAPEEEAQSCR